MHHDDRGMHDCAFVKESSAIAIPAEALEAARTLPSDEIDAAVVHKPHVCVASAGTASIIPLHFPCLELSKRTSSG